MPSRSDQLGKELEPSNVVPLNVERRLEEVFAVTEFVGDDRPPRSAKLVAACSWSWGPAHGRSETYLLHGTRDRKDWTLWIHAPACEMGTCYSVYAWGRSATPFAPAEAARALLREAWEAEWKLYNSPGDDLYVDREGLLSTQELLRLAESIFKDDKD